MPAAPLDSNLLRGCDDVANPIRKPSPESLPFVADRGAKECIDGENDNDAGDKDQQELKDVHIYHSRLIILHSLHNTFDTPNSGGGHDA